MDLRQKLLHDITELDRKDAKDKLYSFVDLLYTNQPSANNTMMLLGIKDNDFIVTNMLGEYSGCPLVSNDKSYFICIKNIPEGEPESVMIEFDDVTECSKEQQERLVDFYGDYENKTNIQEAIQCGEVIPLVFHGKKLLKQFLSDSDSKFRVLANSSNGLIKKITLSVHPLQKSNVKELFVITRNNKWYSAAYHDFIQVERGTEILPHSKSRNKEESKINLIQKQFEQVFSNFWKSVPTQYLNFNFVKLNMNDDGFMTFFADLKTRYWKKLAGLGLSETDKHLLNRIFFVDVPSLDKSSHPTKGDLLKMHCNPNDVFSREFDVLLDISCLSWINNNIVLQQDSNDRYLLALYNLRLGKRKPISLVANNLNNLLFDDIKNGAGMEQPPKSVSNRQKVLDFALVLGRAIRFLLMIVGIFAIIIAVFFTSYSYNYTWTIEL